jgi:hypothetical protein
MTLMTMRPLRYFRLGNKTEIMALENSEKFQKNSYMIHTDLRMLTDLYLGCMHTPPQHSCTKNDICGCKSPLHPKQKKYYTSSLKSVSSVEGKNSSWK